MLNLQLNLLSIETVYEYATLEHLSYNSDFTPVELLQQSSYGVQTKKMNSCN